MGGAWSWAGAAVTRVEPTPADDGNINHDIGQNSPTDADEAARSMPLFSPTATGGRQAGVLGRRRLR